MEVDVAAPDAFDAIVMAETRFHSEGYQEGYDEGIHAGVAEGRQYGIQQGACAGLEIGSYLGFAVTWKKLLHKCSDEKHSMCLHACLAELSQMFGLFWNCLPINTMWMQFPFLLQIQSKKIKILESLIKMIEEFPHEDPAYDKLQEDLEKIRGKFKQVCSLLHIPSDFRLGTEGSALTF